MSVQAHHGLLIKIELTQKDLVNILKGEDVFQHIRIMTCGSEEFGVVQIYRNEDEEE